MKTALREMNKLDSGSPDRRQNHAGMTGLRPTAFCDAAQVGITMPQAEQLRLNGVTNEWDGKSDV